MLVSESKGNKKLYKANDKHPLFKEIHSILLKYIGVDKVIEVIIERMGDLEKVYLTGDYAKGQDSGIIDLVFVGDIDKNYLISMVSKGEKLVKKKVRFITYGTEEWADDMIEKANRWYLFAIVGE